MHACRFTIIESSFIDITGDWKNIRQEIHGEQSQASATGPGYRLARELKAIRRILKMHIVLSKRVRKNVIPHGWSPYHITIQPPPGPLARVLSDARAAS